MEKESKKTSIGKAAFVLMIGTIVSKALGLFRELSVAYKYGAGSISDAFILTNGIPNLIFSAFAIAISINFIPCYTQINGKENQDFFTSNLINLLTCVILAGCILVCFAPKLVLMLFGSGLSGETEAYATIMLRIVVFSSIC